MCITHLGYQGSKLTPRYSVVLPHGEHAIGDMKRYNILVHCFRNRRSNFHDDVIAICAALWNFSLIY